MSKLASTIWNFHRLAQRATAQPRLIGQTFRYLSQTTDATVFDNEKLSKMVKDDKVVVFMKGDPESPRCGFSNAVVQVWSNLVDIHHLTS